MEKLCKIRDIQRAVYHFEVKFEKRYGIGLNEGMALCSLSVEGCLSSGRLGELLGLTLSNTSKVIRSVEEKGLIGREMGKEDKRRMFFVLTDKGRELLSQIKCGELCLPEILEKAIEKS